ncbi:stage II sporulation protein M [Microaerobacter geothermalis]|uniref:stage II sporulation protein M n=1 Tax=Microaerobacter geothermalis TaxID=674972 RepID=UPI001F1EB3D2|nr:stage II sporulation protein M [Microaerobacter geothermalis]MCF6095286.1 stage II sporulation protein M [Microaerobacter geothermalis]
MRKFFTSIKTKKKYIAISLVFLLVGIFAGYTTLDFIQQNFKDQLEQIFSKMKRLAEEIQERHSIWFMFQSIFINNVLAAFTMIGLGLFFGFIPAYLVFINGVVLGFVLKMYANSGGDPVSMLFSGILPHGVVELFAILLAAAIGMKLGVHMFHLMRSLWNKDIRAETKEKFLVTLKELPRLVVGIVVLLFIAAWIETVITPLIITIFLPQSNYIF